MPLGRHARAKLPREPRFPHARLAEQKHVLAVPVRRPLPSVEERADLHVAPDEARETAGRKVEAAPHPARTHDPVERQRLAHTLQHLRPALLDHEHAGHQPLGRVGDHHRVGLGGARQARRDVRRLAEDLAAVGDDHGAGVHADSHGEPRPVLRRELLVHADHGVEDRKPGAHRSLRIVLPRGRPAEVDEQAVPHLLGDVSAPRGDGGARGLLILLYHVAPLFRIELLRERRRADEITEEHGQLSPFAGGHSRFGRGEAGRHLRRCGGRSEPCAASAAELLARFVRGAA